jgi:hypothetical protein
VLAVLLIPAHPAGAALMPTEGQVVPNGSDVQGECVLQEGQESGRLAWWKIQAVIPAFTSDLNLPGIEVAPPPQELPRFSKSPTDPFGNSYVEDPKLLTIPSQAGCQVMSFDPLQATTLAVPGPYVIEQHVETVHFHVAPADGDPPPAQPCANNDAEFPDPTSDIAPPPTSDTWVVDAYCNTVSTTGFYVQGASSCPISGDMSKWPRGSPYINQYDTGKRLGLPVRSHRAGGNACGPSSLLMTMLATAGSGRIPGLKEAFNATVRGNVFASKPALAFVKSLGWKSARAPNVPKDVEGIENTILTSMSNASGSGPGPIVLSTAFGGATWGETGGGHMIAIVGTDGRGSFIVDDPAGNYFSTPKNGYSDTKAGGHYGPKSCGHRALYPHFWVLAYARGRWLLALGARTLPRRTPRAAVTPRLGSAIAVSDAHPGGADAPQSFWLQDAEGNRAGFVDGQIVEEIPDASVGQAEGGWTDPAVGDPAIEQDTTGQPQAAPRSIVVPGPGTGLTLHVAAAGAYALTSEAWVDGALVASDAVRTDASLPAVQAIARYTRLTVGKARFRGRSVKVPLTCAGPSPCRFAITLSAKGGTLARRTATVRKRLVVRLAVRKRKLTATLVVSQLRPGVPAVEVSSQRVRL